MARKIWEACDYIFKYIGWSAILSAIHIAGEKLDNEYLMGAYWILTSALSAAIGFYINGLCIFKFEAENCPKFLVWLGNSTTFIIAIAAGLAYPRVLTKLTQAIELATLKN
jgi:hypothetical protein